MSATIIAAKIVREWPELSKDNPVNVESYLRNLLLAFQAEVQTDSRMAALLEVSQATDAAERRAAA